MPDRKVVITGTSRGIGYHLAQRFLSEGYGVIGVSRSQAPITHPEYHQISADLRDIDQIRSLSTELSRQTICGLINNAGIHGPIGRFEETPIDEWLSTFNINLFAAAALTQACVPSLRSNNGFVIFISGGGSAFPRVNFSAYGVSKCGVIRLAEVLAHELAPEVYVYCVAPGPNRTALLNEALDSGDVVPDRDIVDFSEPERLCLYLARNRDLRYSGKFIHVNDTYQDWDDAQLATDAYTLRRIDPRTLAKINLT